MIFALQYPEKGDPTRLSKFLHCVFWGNLYPMQRKDGLNGLLGGLLGMEAEMLIETFDR